MLPPRINIVGAGDVVSHRIVPALLTLHGPEFVEKRVAVHTIDASDSLIDALAGLGVTPKVYDRFLAHEQNEAELAAHLVADGASAIVATPSIAHGCYSQPLLEHGIRCAVEKPLSTIAAEIDLLGQLPDPQALFALSYYALEKALPLTYLFAPHPAFEPLLEVADQPAEEQRKLCEAMRQELGPVLRLQVELIEGRERSPTAGRRVWTERAGGLAFETLLHPLLLAKQAALYAGADFARFEPVVTRGCSRDSVVPEVTNFLRLTGRCGSLELDLVAAKYAGERSQHRGGVATFAGGEVRFDFDRMSLVVATRSAADVEIRLRAAFRGKYLAQCTLLSDFFVSGWRGEPRFDGYRQQVEVLNWLLRHDFDLAPAFTYDEDTDLASRSSHVSLR